MSAEGKTREEAIQFQADYEEYRKMPGYDEKFPGCETERFIYWDCCDAHRALRDESERLHTRAVLFGVDAGDAQVMSAHWWQCFGAKFGIDLPHRFPYYV